MRLGKVLCVTMLISSGALACSAASLPGAIPVIFDTDIGGDIDDTWALVMLLKNPRFDVKLITTTYGAADYRAKLIAKMLTIAGRSDIPIGLGEGGLVGSGGQHAWVDDYSLSDYHGQICQDGVGAVIDVIDRSPQPVTVISTGPAETMSAVLDRSPETASKAALVGMYGSIRKGYYGGAVCAEWNVGSDSAAAGHVLSAPWRETSITPLDTCGLVDLSGERFETLKRSSDPCVQALLENYCIWKNERDGMMGTVGQLQASSLLCDTAAIYLADPGNKPLVQMEDLPILVTDDGFTQIDASGHRMSVATAWTDIDGFRDLLVTTLTSPVPSPEPSSIVTLTTMSVIGSLAYAWRRRRRVWNAGWWMCRQVAPPFITPASDSDQ